MTRIPLTTLHTQIRRGVGYLGILFFSLFGLISTASAVVDEAINKGVWKFLYNATDAQVNSPTWLAADDDGDGLTNQAELDAGTNPFRPSSVFKVTTLTATATNVSMVFPTRTNKMYVAQVATGSGQPTTWVNVTPAVQILGNNGSRTLVVPRSAGTYFRVLAQDLDTDNDGVSDWAETVVGLSPTSATSNGNLDRDGLPITDSAWVNSQFLVQRQVSIAAVDPTAIQPPTAVAPAPKVGKFVVTRKGFSAFMPALTVNLSIGGTATAGTDYTALPVTVSFLANQASKEILVTPRFNANRTNSVSVVAVSLKKKKYTIVGQGW